MTRLLSFILAAILFLAVASEPATVAAGLPISQEVPKTATVEIVLVNAPGINDEASNWEIAYEFRIADLTTLWQVWKQKQMGAAGDDRVGQLIKEGSVKKAFRSPDDRKMLFQIPLGPEIQEKLRNQPRDQVNFTPGKPTAEEIRLSREYELRTQSFLFHSVISFYDAKLKKNLMIPARFHWPCGSYPQARFEIKIAINNDGSYSVNTSLPTKKGSN